jgi:hypothetical protein
MMKAMTSDTDERSTPAPSRALRRAWIGIALVAVALAGLLVGTGFDLGSLTGDDDVEPDPVAGLDGLEDVDWATGVPVASDERAGAGADLVLADAGGDARCAGIRTDPAAAPTPVRCALDGFVNAWDDPAWRPTTLSEHFGFLDDVAIRDGDVWSVALAGAVSPEIVRVTAHLADGGEYSFVTRNPGGWFVVVLPDSIADPDIGTGELVNPPVALDLYDDVGSRITVIDLTAPPQLS